MPYYCLSSVRSSLQPGNVEDVKTIDYFFEPRYVYSPAKRRYMRLRKIGELEINSTGKRTWCQYPDEVIHYDSEPNNYPINGFSSLAKDMVLTITDQYYAIPGGSVIKTKLFGHKEPRATKFYLYECNLPEEYVAE